MCVEGLRFERKIVCVAVASRWMLEILFTIEVIQLEKGKGSAE